MDVCYALILVSMGCGYYCFDVVRMFLFRSGAVVVVSFCAVVILSLCVVVLLVLI
jgi:hypothetical protein